eukprot:c12275_g1_i1.p1 GENE.c12275_g1_i1~~c12275_g1_i1.p1  ORF type:complete len:534 (+),score=91.53 c12275_g1_i1:223-1602(+)
MFVSSFVMVVIFMSCSSFIVETLPTMQIYSANCTRCKPLRGDDYVNETLIEQRHSLAESCVDCEPTTSDVFNFIEKISIAVFTVEYVLRILTVPFTRSQRERQIGKFYVFPRFRGLRRTIMFVFTFLNLVDLVAILPFYLELIQVGPGAQIAVVRVIRLFRVFRILRIGQLSEGVQLFSGVINLSLTSFMVFVIFSLFAMVIFASLMFYAESGTWDPTTGEYLRDSAYYLAPPEPSPYTSIPQTFWWTLVTFTTVGYGDMVPATTIGKVLGSITMYTGIILIAMPITIMGVNLSSLYAEDQQRRARKQRVLAEGAKLLRIIVHGRGRLPLRFAWNVWRDLIKKPAPLSTHDLVKEEVAKLIRSLSLEYCLASPAVKGPSASGGQQGTEGGDGKQQQDDTPWWGNADPAKLQTCGVTELVQREVEMLKAVMLQEMRQEIKKMRRDLREQVAKLGPRAEEA